MVTLLLAILALLLASHGAPVRATRDDGTAQAQLACKKRHRNAAERRACLSTYLERKASATSSSAGTAHAAVLEDGCAEPTDDMSSAQRLVIDQCLHAAEGDNSKWLHAHISQPVAACHADEQGEDTKPMSAALRRRCLFHAGDANWTARGLLDNHPECGRTWIAADCARKLLAGRDLMFIGNSVIRRQMYTVIDLLAGPSARRLTHGSRTRTPEVVPVASLVPDAGELEDAALRTQEGVLNSHLAQSIGPAWTALSVAQSRLWDRGDEANAYHAAQLVTIDLNTGVHRFDRPHVLCGLTDTFSKFRADRNAQFRRPGEGRGGSALHRNWQQTKWAGREWRPLVSFRWHHGVQLPSGRAGASGHPASSSRSCAERALFLPGSRPACQLEEIAARDSATAAASSTTRSSAAAPTVLRGPAGSVVQSASRLRATVLAAIRELLRSPATSQPLPEMFYEGLHNVSVQIELPAASGARSPNVWILFPTYHGERQRFNGFCEDGHAGCECTDQIGRCTARLCRGKRLCRPLPATSAAFVGHAQTLAAALVARGKLAGGKVERVQTSVFYDDCWEGRGRCHGNRPCAEPGDHMLSCRATAMLCAAAPWTDVVTKAKSWVPPGHASA